MIDFIGDYTHWKGIEISDFTQDPSNPEGWNLMYVRDSDHNIFEQFNGHHCGSGFYLRGSSTDNLVLNSDFHHNQDPYTATAYDNADGIGLGWIDYGSTNTVRGCRFWWNSDDGLDLWLNEGIIIIEDTWSWYNGYIPDTFDVGGNGNGFKLGRQDEDHGSEVLRTITNCVAAHNRQLGYTPNGATCNIALYNNIAYENGETGGWGGGFEFAGSIPYYINNNIAYQNLPAEVDIGNNANVSNNSWNGSTVTDADFVSLDVNQLDDPRKADGSLPDITFGHLASDSDLINAGVNVGLDYNGVAPDIGAFESP